MDQERIAVDPKLKPEHKKDLWAFCLQLSRSLSKATPQSRDDILLKWKSKINGMYAGHKFHAYTDLSFIKNLLLDLLLQDWELHLHLGKIHLQLPIEEAVVNHTAQKNNTRRRHLLARDVQLQIPSVRQFITDMEKRRLTPVGWHSIFSVMRDGTDLQQQLKEIALLPQDMQMQQLRQQIKPYIQFVEAEQRCAHTGMLLSEIWRYFRHTWTTEYKSLPGRSISILIRDAAAPNHPVIGIAALGSSVAQQSCRDEWIGWEGKTFLQKMDREPSTKHGKWLLDMLQNLIKETYITDFVREKILSRKQLNYPTEELVVKLRELSMRYKAKHTHNPNTAKFTTGNENMNWKDRAETYLFKSKRATLLSELLSVRRAFNEQGFTTGSSAQLKASLTIPVFRGAVQRLVRKAKAIHVGINMMDIIVCGSIAPYNHILGGKLVCMLLTSPEVVQYYNKKYGEYISLIASSMNGKPVVRKPQLVYLGTTSLYGVGSSQYNRIKIPAEIFGGQKTQTIEYKELGTSEGFGSFHFSSSTIKLADTVAGRENGRTRVNSIFGEGANPLLRKIRESLEYLNLESGPILNHRNRRVVYGIALAENFGDILLGLAKKPIYLIAPEKPQSKTAMIAEYWTKRWLMNRIQNDEILEQVQKHSLAYPISHGARVPIIKNEEQLELFDIKTPDMQQPTSRKQK